MRTISRRSAQTKLAYLVNAHDDRTLSDAVKLINAISHPDNLILIHVDKKYPKKFWEQSELFHILDQVSLTQSPLAFGRRAYSSR